MANKANPTQKAEAARARLLALDAEKATRLLDPATAEFSTHGYTGASLNRILTRAGMSKGQAYYYITGKADLYLAVCERAFQPIARAAGPVPDSLPDGASFWAAIIQLVDTMAVLGQEKGPIADLGRTVYESPESEAALAPLIARVESYITAWIRLGQRAGAVRTDLPDELLQTAFLALLREMDRWFSKNCEGYPLEKLEAMNRAALQMLRAAASPPDTRDA